MDDTHDFLAGVLTSGGRALAGYAAQALIDERPEAAEQFGPAPLEAWQSCLSRRSI